MAGFVPKLLGLSSQVHYYAVAFRFPEGESAGTYFDSELAARSVLFLLCC
jgi:hypothetical protein